MEKVIVRQDKQFAIEFWAVDPDQPDAEEYQPVQHIHDLTPYGMLLASLGACTAIVLHTYAQHHGVDLQEVELRLEYKGVFDEDCENCEEIEEYEEQISEEMVLVGDLAVGEREKLLHIAHHCPIYKMLKDGMQLNSYLAPQS